MTIYSPTFDTASGYGRLSLACQQALGARRVTKDPDFAIALPQDRIRSHFRFTMWESTEVPFNQRNLAKVFIVPCTHNKHVWPKAIVCPLFADTVYANLPQSRPFKFICVAKDNGVQIRKGIDDLIKWFTLAFPTEDDVQLTIKMSAQCTKRYTFDKRITLLYIDHDRKIYQQLLAEHHCGIFLSGLESWNLPATELMAIGRPSIIIPWGGPADYVDSSTSYLVPYTHTK